MSASHDLGGIPDELKAIPRWCGFQIVHGPLGKTKKLPLVSGVPGRVMADCSNPRTLRPFAEAQRDAELRGLHVAFAFSPDLPYFFIDADDVVDERGTIRPDVLAVRDALDTYTEVSTSGAGLHIIGRGVFPEHSTNQQPPDGAKPLERYPLHGGRFCIFTGNTLPGFETVEDRQEALTALFPGRPGSANGHERGAYQGSSGELTAAEMDAVVAWAGPFWIDGRRHHLALHLSGYLAKQGVSREQAVAIIERCAAGDADPGAKVAACHGSFDAREGGEPVSGWHGLVDVCGLSREQIAPLDSVLSGFWRRTHPKAPEVDEPDSMPAFPVDDLPGAWSAYVAEVSAALPVPAEMVALPMLVEIGALIGNRALLHVKSGWFEAPSLYGVVVAPSGSLKTPAFKLARWPLRQLQKAARVEFEGKLSLWEDDHARWEAEKKGLRGSEPVRPVMRDYFTTDATMEAMAPMLKTTPGIVYESDEIVAWVERMNQYRKGGDRQQFMSIHSGESIKVNRKSQDTIYIDRPVVGVFGGVQPDILPALRGDVKGDDGFVYRYLPIIPDVGPKQWNTNEIRSGALADIAALFRAIDALPLIGDGDPLLVTLAPEAEKVFAAWSDHNNAEAWRLGGALRGFYVKLEAHVARFILILHVASDPYLSNREVSAETAHRAIRVGEFFRGQIHRFIPLMGIGSGEGSMAIGLWSRIERVLRRAWTDASMEGVNVSTTGVTTPDGENTAQPGQISEGVNVSTCPQAEMGWVSFRALQRALRSPDKDLLLKELDTYIDSRHLVTREVSFGTGRRVEYQLSAKYRCGHVDTLTPSENARNGADSGKRGVWTPPVDSGDTFGRVPWEENE